MPCECPTGGGQAVLPSSSSLQFHCGEQVQLFSPVTPVPLEVKAQGGGDIGLCLCSPQWEMETFLVSDSIFCLMG